MKKKTVDAIFWVFSFFKGVQNFFIFFWLFDDTFLGFAMVLKCWGILGLFDDTFLGFPLVLFDYFWMILAFFEKKTKEVDLK